MFMYYKDKKYFLAIQDYKKGNRDSAIAILKINFFIYRLFYV